MLASVSQKTTHGYSQMTDWSWLWRLTTTVTSCSQICWATYWNLGHQAGLLMFLPFCTRSSKIWISETWISRVVPTPTVKHMVEANFATYSCLGNSRKDWRELVRKVCIHSTLKKICKSFSVRNLYVKMFISSFKNNVTVSLISQK